MRNYNARHDNRGLGNRSSADAAQCGCRAPPLEIHPETPVSGWKNLSVSCIGSTKLLHSQVNQTGCVARKILEVGCKRSKYRQERHFAHRLASRASVITAKAANGYHFKTGHSTNVRDKGFLLLQ